MIKDVFIGDQRSLRKERERLVVIAPDRIRFNSDYARAEKPALTPGEIGRKVMSLRGWRRVLVRIAGVPVG